MARTMARIMVLLLTPLWLGALAAQGLLAQETKGREPAPKDSVALEPVVVTATRMETPLQEVIGSCTVITAEEIAAKQYRTVQEALKSVPGLDVVRAGALGQQTSVFLRGGNSEHVLVLIDGVVANDPSMPGRNFDFAHLTTDNVERIEVMRGPQSVLYGSDAMTGVIQIITRKGQGGPRAHVALEGGSFRTLRESAAVSGSKKRVNYALAVSRTDSDGISAAAKKDGNHEHDGYQNTAVSLRLGVQPTEKSYIDFIGRYQDTRTEMDNFGGPLGDDPNSLANAHFLHLRLQGGLRLWDDRLDTRLAASLADYRRKYDNDTDASHPGDSSYSTYDSSLYKFEWQNDLRLAEWNTLSLGAEYQEEEMNSRYTSESVYYGMSYVSSERFPEKSRSLSSVYLQEQLQWQKRYFITLGARLDEHEDFGSKATWKAAAAYIVPVTESKLSVSYGTAFKAPSLYQLYAHTDYVQGNRHLDPEENRGWDIRLEQPLWERRIVLSAAWFQNDFKNLITTDLDENWVYRYVNINRARARGVELEARIAPVEQLEFSASYTYTDTEDRETGLDLLRRPRHKFAFNTHWQVLESLGADLQLLCVGRRRDTFYNEATYESGRVTLAGYALLNAAISWDVTKNVQLQARVENLLDRDYEEVWGYGTPGIGAYAGIRVGI
ncbi:MAG: TonB-dependent receptor [Deltaproteobacteria bacterium]|nr:TonB-dependent receptor [Deltaproteobacteria bacterium]